MSFMTEQLRLKPCWPDGVMIGVAVTQPERARIAESEAEAKVALMYKFESPVCKANAGVKRRAAFRASAWTIC